MVLAPSKMLSLTGAVMRASVLEKKLKAGKRLGQCSEKLTLHFSAPMFQLKPDFSSEETPEMSGKCVVALATGKEVGQLVTERASRVCRMGAASSGSRLRRWLRNKPFFSLASGDPKGQDSHFEHWELQELAPRTYGQKPEAQEPS